MDEQNTKICSNCSTINSADFTYCKNCGTQLYSSQPETAYEPQAYIPPQYRQNAFYENDGVDAQTMSSFVGKNADTYLSKFTTMKLSNKRVSWHWPVFVLGFLLGPVGMAFWFFYRKMYKTAFLLLAIGTVLTFGDLWTSFVHPLNKVIEEFGTQIFAENAVLSDATLTKIGLTFMSSTHPLNILFSIASIAVTILFPMFAFSMYEKFALKRINSLRLPFEDKGTRQFYIAKTGGTKTLAAVLSPILYYLAIIIAYIVFVFIYALNISLSML